MSSLTVMGCLLFINLLPATQADGATNNVSSISALQTAINGAHAGDTIILANGSYTTTSLIGICFSCGFIYLTLRG